MSTFFQASVEAVFYVHVFIWALYFSIICFVWQYYACLLNNQIICGKWRKFPRNVIFAAHVFILRQGFKQSCPSGFLLDISAIAYEYLLHTGMAV